jgi:hypothetical protein
MVRGVGELAVLLLLPLLGARVNHARRDRAFDSFVADQSHASWNRLIAWLGRLQSIQTSTQEAVGALR